VTPVLNGDLASTKGGRLLVVASDPTLQSAMGILLRDAGFTVYGAADADVVEAALRVAAFDLVLIDVTEPKLDAPRSIELVRWHDPMARVLVITGMYADDAATEAEMLGADGFVNKPLELPDVLLHVGLLLGV
jgi:DNA-binding response OmpR family regulator